MRWATSRWNIRIAAVVPGRPRLDANPRNEQGGGNVVWKVGDDTRRPMIEARARIECQGIGRNHVKAPGISLGDFVQRGDCALIALHRDHPIGAERKQRTGKSARPGADLETVVPASAPAARAIRAARLRSSRKFCPSDFLAMRPCRRMTSRSGGRPSGAAITTRQAGQGCPPSRAAPPASAR